MSKKDKKRKKQFDMGSAREPEEIPQALPPRAKPLSKLHDPLWTKMGCYIKKETHHKVKVELTRKNMELSDLVENLCTEWLQTRNAE